MATFIPQVVIKCVLEYRENFCVEHSVRFAKIQMLAADSYACSELLIYFGHERLVFVIQYAF